MSEKRPREHASYARSAAADELGELKFLQVQFEDETGGGWYRELDDSEIEVLSRARLERVHLQDSLDAESTARGKIAEMMGRPRGTNSDKSQ